MIKVTIIIPVYNGESTISKTLYSIIPQLDETTELIIINDGSIDDSENIVKNIIAKQEKQIIYYSQENKGIAATRNFGILQAKGDYIMFVDSDDTIKDTLLQELQPYINDNIDIIKFKAQNIDENGRVVEKINGPVFDKVTGDEAFNRLAFDDKLMDSPCVYVFKKDIFIRNNLLFREGTYHEDFGLIPQILILARSVISLDIYGYNYIQTNNSITRNNHYEKTIKKFEDVLLHYDNMLQFIDKFSIKTETVKNIKSYYTNAVLLKLKTINKEDRKKYIKEIKKRKMIKNVRIKGIRQFMKRIILRVNINWYLNLI